MLQEHAKLLPTEENLKKEKLAVREYLQKVKDHIIENQMKSVYVTDHTPKPRKYNTLSQKEDEQFMKYH